MGHSSPTGHTFFTYLNTFKGPKDQKVRKCVQEPFQTLRRSEFAPRFSAPRLAFKELQAQEDEALHAREVSLLASSLHRLGMRYGRLLGQCQALEALVPERVRRMNEGSSSNARSNARP
ncbi:unnamed protein product [Durusdinium trenchii]|uniref:Uncharacterized protein n=1 Tax=Durusdinium trenchii TaxID=1381693 RepID=A0ABP0QUD5_9DINO